MTMLYQGFVAITCLVVASLGWPAVRSPPDVVQIQDQQVLVVDSYQPCWPEMKDILDRAVDLSDQTPLIEMYLATAMKMVFRIDVINKETRDAGLKQLVCKLSGVHNVSDLVQLLPMAPERQLRMAYMQFQQVFRAIGGMDTVRSIASACDSLIQLFIDMDFPHVPIKAIGRQEAQDKLLEIIRKLMPVLSEFIAFDSIDKAELEGVSRVLDALYDSANIFEFSASLHAADGAPVFYQVGSDLPTWQKLLHLDLELVEELYSHGWMNLAG